MRQGSVRLWGTMPTASNLRACLAEFAARGPGRVTAIDGELAPKLALWAEESLSPVAFSELIATCLTLAGVKGNLPIADSDQIAEAVRHSLRRVPEDNPFHASRAFPGTVRRVASALALLREHRVDWHSAPFSTWDAPLRAKAEALAALQADVDSILARLGCETPDRRVARCLGAELPPEERSRRLLAVAGLEYRPQAAYWLRWAARQGWDVVAVAPWRGPSDGSFDAARRWAEALDVPIEPRGELPSPARELFTDRVAEGAEWHARVESAADPLAECEWAMRRVLADLQEGIPAEKVALFCRDLAGYAPKLQAAAIRFGVPLQLTLREPLAANRLVQWISALLEGLCVPRPKRLVESLVGSYAGLEPAVLLKLREAAEDAGRFGERAWEAFADTVRQESGAAWIVEILRLRDQAVQDRPLAEWREWLAELVALEPFDRLATDRSVQGSRDRQALGELLQALDRRLRVEPAGPAKSLAEFRKEAAEIWAAVEMSYAPAGPGLRVASSPLALLDSVSVHALGVLEGLFPRRRSEDPILSDSEREALNGGLNLPDPLPLSREIAQAERDVFLALVAAPSRRLALSYPTADDDRDNVPAFYLAELERAMGGRIERVHRPCGRLTPESPILDSDRRLSEALSAAMEPVRDELLEDEESLSTVRAGLDDAFTPRNLRDALQCPFAYAFSRRLAVGPKSEPDPWARFLRVPQSVDLAGAANREEAGRKLDQAVEAELEAARGQVPDEQWRLLEAGARRLARIWLESELRSRDTWPMSPIRSPATFDGETLADSVPIDGGRIGLRGKIDGVAEMGPYRVAKVGGVRAPLVAKRPSDWTEAEKLEAALYLAAMPNDREAAIEFSTSDGDRHLVLRERVNGMEVRGLVKDGMRVSSLDSRTTGFMGEAGGIFARAVAQARGHRMETCPGDHCERCRYGELCRRSKDFGEQAIPGEEAGDG